MKLHKLITDMSSEAYHGLEGTYSSSQFKTMNEDAETFHKKYILKAVAKESNAAFDVGTYYHTGTLEPHKLASECVVFNGYARRGEKWNKFVKKHKGKYILTSKQKEQGDDLIKATRKSPVAMSHIKKAKPEISLFVELVVVGDNVYAPFFKKKLTINGWVPGDWQKDPLKAKALKLIVKVRADALGDTFILDLKSTTGNAKDDKAMRSKISMYDYDLSAALYLDLFSLINKNIIAFIWTFASKDFKNCQSYKASKKNIQVGRAKYIRALRELARHTRAGWKFPDELRTLEPMVHELENLSGFTDNDNDDL